MKKFSIKAYKAILLTLLVSTWSMLACAPKGPSGDFVMTKRPPVPEVIDIAAILGEKGIPNKRKAEKLVDAAEKLVTPIGFMFAFKAFGQALKIDATNAKAKFYLEFLKPLMKLKGIFARVKPLYENGLNDKTHYQNEINSLAEGGLKDFMMNGEPNIHDELQLQGAMDEFYLAYDKYRNYLKGNKALNLKLKIRLTNSEAVKNCYVLEIEPGVYKESKCDSTSSKERLVDRSDIEIMQHLIAGIQVTMAMWAAWDSRGSMLLRKESKGQDWTEEQIVNFLERQGQFGKLRPENTLSQIPKLQSDIFAGAKWALKFQDQLCPKGVKVWKSQRPGYLFSSGLCMRQPTYRGKSAKEKVFAMIDLALKGVSQDFSFVNYRAPRVEGVKPIIMTTQVNPLAIIYNPPDNIKNIFPNQFDECGRPAGFKDKSLGNTFPLRNADEIMRAHREAWKETDPEREKCDSH